MAQLIKIVARRNRDKASRIMSTRMNYRMRLAALSTADIASSEKYWS